MPRMLCVPRFDENGAGPRYRMYQYFDSFRLLGFDITVKPLLENKYLKNLYFKKKRSIFYLIKVYFKRAVFLFFNKSKFDLFFMDGELFPYLPFFIEKFFLPKHYIIDQDDAIFHTYDGHKSFFVRLILGKKISKIWKRSQHVVITNDYIKQKVILMGAKKITVLPTVVNADLYKPFPVKRCNKQIIVGWVGSPTTITAMDHIKEALLNISRKADFVLYIIGANYTLENVKTICVDWKNGWSETEEIKLTNEIDIGIMPLLDGPFQKGKGGFKLIKYMACAKPMVASSVGMNVEIVDHEKNGYLASSVADWEKYLLLLIENADLRAQFGREGRQKMLEKYSFQVTNPILCNIMKEAIAN